MKAERTETTFTLRYAVRTAIAASPQAIWERLTDADGFSRWNSTVDSIEGPIAPGQKLKIRVPVAPGRVFTPKVVEFVPAERMTWRDGFAPMFRGTRTYTLTPRGGATEFEAIATQPCPAAIDDHLNGDVGVVRDPQIWRPCSIDTRT